MEIKSIIQGLESVKGTLIDADPRRRHLDAAISALGQMGVIPSAAMTTAAALDQLFNTKGYADILGMNSKEASSYKTRWNSGKMQIAQQHNILGKAGYEMLMEAYWEKK